MPPAASARPRDWPALLVVLAIVAAAQGGVGLLRHAAPSAGALAVVLAVATATYWLSCVCGMSRPAASLAAVFTGCAPIALVAGAWVGGGTVAALVATVVAALAARTASVRRPGGRSRAVAALVLGVAGSTLATLLVGPAGGWGSGGGPRATGWQAVAIWWDVDPLTPLVVTVAAVVTIVNGPRVLGVVALAVPVVVGLAGLRAAVLVAALPAEALIVVMAADVVWQWVSRARPQPDQPPSGETAAPPCGRVSRGLVVGASVALAALVAASVLIAGTVPAAGPGTAVAAAARWISSQAPDGDRAAVDSGSLRQLAVAGEPTAPLIALTAGGSSAASGVQWLLAGPAVRKVPRGSWAGRALRTSRTVASFGNSGHRVDVRAVATDTHGNPVPAPTSSPTARPSPTATPTIGSTTAPAQAAHELATNPNVTLSDTARTTLLTSPVDARLLTVLAQIAASTPLSVTDFPAVPGDAANVPRRSVVIDEIGGVDVAGATDAVASLQITLAAQAPDYRPVAQVVGSGPQQRLVLTLPA